MVTVEQSRIAEAYAEELASALGDNLRRVALFGSRARGDHHPRSDYDLMIVLRDPSGSARSTVHRLATTLELVENVDLSTKILSEAQFEALVSSPFPFWRRYRRDERVLWPSLS